MNRNFDFYEYAGFIVPGAVLILGLLYFFPDGHVYFTKEGVTFGELGIFVIVSYAAGQLLQSIGNLIELIVELPTGGRLTERALAGKLFSIGHYKRLAEALKTDPKIASDVTKADHVGLRPIVGLVYARVAAAGKAIRVDSFNGNYGLMRGLAAVFLLLIVVAAVLFKGWHVVAVLTLLFALAMQRMLRYSRHYTHELFTQYLLIDRT